MCSGLMGRGSLEKRERSSVHNQAGQQLAKVNKRNRESKKRWDDGKVESEHLEINKTTGVRR